MPLFFRNLLPPALSAGNLSLLANSCKEGADPVDDDIIKNIRLIERLKYGILQWMAHLFRALYNGPEKLIQDSLSSLILYCYLLGNRVGVSFSHLDQGINDKARAYLKEQDNQEHGIPPEEVLLFLRYRETHKN
ncbi:MAG: hypothetical protein C4554_05480 [Dethiobacter sp.]|nr:MAG: hypothetical protein C4554_05480 [Dethiobacter sp.]